MTNQKSRRLRIGLAILLTTLTLPLSSSYGDIVTLKDGKKLEGKITMEAADFIKLELSRSGSIKETKLLKRADIATIAKTKPDALALSKIKQGLPTPSLMTSSSYQSMIQTGPEAFLTAYPDSLHKTEVKKILEELKAEKAKVDRGAIKLEGEWISAERRQNFKTLINSRVRLYSMKQKAARRNPTGAMRDFQIIEEQFRGTPAYPEAIKVAASILPTYGQLLTRQLKDVEFLNKKREADIKLLPPENQARTQAAYKKEQDRFKALAEQEKKTGIKWRSVNRRNKDSIEPMIDTVKKEIGHLQKIDTNKLAAQAKLLVQVDELINENKLKEAQEQLVEAGGKTSTRSRQSTGRKGGKTKSTYSEDLSKKITSKIQSAKTAAETATVNAKAKEVADTITASSKMDDKKDDKAVAEEKSAESAMAAAMAARKKAADAKKEKNPTEPSPKKTANTKQTKRPATSAPAASSGGGINFQYLLFGFVAVMGIVIVVMKKMGIGGGGSGGGGDE
ncbi:MAG: hypothetical protein QM496_12400 [Verrucomicrobiota bacterium]